MGLIRSYLDDAQKIQALPLGTDYMAIMNQAAQATQAMPWSAESQRKREQQDLQQQLMEQRLAAGNAEMGMRAQMFPLEQQFQQAKLKYYLDRLKSQSGGGDLGTILDEYNSEIGSSPSISADEAFVEPELPTRANPNVTGDPIYDGSYDDMFGGNMLGG